MSDDREALPRWRQRREPTAADQKRLADIGIPKRYIGADMLRDLPDLSFTEGSSYYLHGPSGSGKTHALCAMVRERALSRFDRRECLFTTVDEMLSEIRAGYDRPPKRTTYSEDEESQVDCYVTRLKEVEVLALDDLGAERSTEWALGELYSVVNHRYNELKLTYISSNLDLGELSTSFHQRIASRIAGMCEVVHLIGKDRRMSC
jgi:DNA replication protein DnaC/primosomal protein DnaI